MALNTLPLVGFSRILSCMTWNVNTSVSDFHHTPNGLFLRRLPVVFYLHMLYFLFFWNVLYDRRFIEL